ncbi:hypothetical protein D3C74_315910 [compost metagenome]
MGLPMVIFLQFVKFSIIEYTVVSVGPYILKICAFEFILNLLINVIETASPPTKIDFKLSREDVLSVLFKSILNLEGVTCIISTLCFVIKSNVASGSLHSSSFANITLAPFIKGSNVSNTKISKEIDVKDKNTLPAQIGI